MITAELPVNLQSDKEFELLREDDGYVNDLSELGDYVFASLLPEMANSKGGRVDFSISENLKKYN